MSDWNLRESTSGGARFAIQSIDSSRRQHGSTSILRDMPYDPPHVATMSFSLRSATPEQAIADADWLHAELDALAARARRKDVLLVEIGAQATPATEVLAG